MGSWRFHQIYFGRPFDRKRHYSPPTTVSIGGEGMGRAGSCRVENKEIKPGTVKTLPISQRLIKDIKYKR